MHERFCDKNNFVPLDGLCKTSKQTADSARMLEVMGASPTLFLNSVILAGKSPNLTFFRHIRQKGGGVSN